MSDGLTVVTVTYSPGPHLDRFLATLSHATERPVTVIMADNGSTDGAPEEATQRYSNARLLRMDGNLGYGTAVNRAVAEIEPESEFVMVANPDVQWGPRSIDLLLEAAETSGIGLHNGHGGCVVAYADDMRKLRSFAIELLERKKRFRSLRAKPQRGRSLQRKQQLDFDL